MDTYNVLLSIVLNKTGLLDYVFPHLQFASRGQQEVRQGIPRMFYDSKIYLGIQIVLADNNRGVWSCNPTAELQHGRGQTNK